jgi:hypothetical protein
MKELGIVCQSVLAWEPSPVVNRVEEYQYPVKDGEIIEQVQGFSLAPQYSLKQLREIERRIIKKRKLGSQRVDEDSRVGGSRY